MPFRFPQNGYSFVVNQRNDRLPDIVETRNMNFDEEGYVKLSRRTVNVYDVTDEADWDTPQGYYMSSIGDYSVATSDEMFEVDLGTSTSGFSASQDARANVPSPVSDTSTTFFNDEFVVTESTGASSRSGTTWTDRSGTITLTSGKRHPCCNFKSQNWLAIGDGNTVKTYDVSWAAQTTCTIPVGEEIRSIAYNAGLVGFVTLNENEEGSFYVWDGNTAAANYSYAIGANSGFFVVAHKNTFLVLSATGQMLYWTPSGMEPLTALPVYYTQGSINDYRNFSYILYENAAVSVGDTLLFNVSAELENNDEYGNAYLPNMPGGVMCFDPIIGLYHKLSASNAKLISEDTIATTSVNTTTNQLTVANDIQTGTPIRYFEGGTPAIGGLANNQLYYAINVDATHIQFAETRQDAIDGTAISLTGTGNANQRIEAYPEDDYGQMRTSRVGAIHPITQENFDDISWRDLMIGSEVTKVTTSGVSVTQSLSIGVADIPNRGHVTFARTQSAGLVDEWQSVLIRARKLATAEDKIVVKVKTASFKARSSEIEFPQDTTGGTWTDSDTFTTTVDLSEAEVGDEIAIYGGHGAGYTFHISSISESGGTYTVNLDEAVHTTSTNYQFTFVHDKYKKLSTITNESLTNEDGYFDIPIDKKAAWCQVKLELRGVNTTIEDIILVNQQHKPIA